MNPHHNSLLTAKEDLSLMIPALIYVYTEPANPETKDKKACIQSNSEIKLICVITKKHSLNNHFY